MLTSTTKTRQARPTRRGRRGGRGMLAVLVLMVSLSAGLAGNALGAGSATGLVSGTYTAVDFGTTECAALDDVQLHCSTSGFRFRYEGDLVGESISSFDQVINCATGRTYGHGVETFSGSVRGGRPGTLTWRLVFTAEFDCETFFPSSLRVLGVVTKSTGGLASMRGGLHFDDTSYRGVLS